jgi:hypothetical protein
LAHVDVETLDRCVDSACGDGSLLRAAKRAFKTVACGGLDKDRAVIKRLRQSHPDWQLSVADVLSPKILDQSNIVGVDPACDLLALNPPFSLGHEKSVPVHFHGELLHSSVAMAHILRSAEVFAPAAGAVAIVPESLLFSETDEIARQKLEQHYRLDIVAELRNTTFRGARANALVVRLTPGPPQSKRVRRMLRTLTHVHLVRGGLPVFESHTSRAGLPYLHTTDLRDVMEKRSADDCRRVKPIARGVVSGAVILLPRVGLPAKELVSPVHLRSRVQLSDCVFALAFDEMRGARSFAEALHAKWAGVVSLYRGTGARYVTKRRLEGWLSTVET